LRGGVTKIMKRVNQNKTAYFPLNLGALQSILSKTGDSHYGVAAEVLTSFVCSISTVIVAALG
jgi:hypothetical protein